MTSPRTIPQRELRNDVASVLREVEAGATLHVTVRGRHVADLVPPDRRPSHLERQAVERIVADAPLDPAFVRDLNAVAGDTIEDL